LLLSGEKGPRAARSILNTRWQKDRKENDRKIVKLTKDQKNHREQRCGSRDNGGKRLGMTCERTKRLENTRKKGRSEKQEIPRVSGHSNTSAQADEDGRKRKARSGGSTGSGKQYLSRVASVILHTRRQDRGPRRMGEGRTIGEKQPAANTNPKGLFGE